MLAVYKVEIYTEAVKLDNDSSIGFQGGVYRLSTAPSTGFHDCLDGNSFSDISQENMILKGGELSQVGDVKIKIVSRAILEHILQNDIELLGCKVSMFAEIGGTKKDIFEKMLVAGHSQPDEVSIELNLSDSAFANAGQLNLKVPQGYGGGAQLETSYGGECLLRLYKQNESNAQNEAASWQGINGSSYSSPSLPELELPMNPGDEVLTTLDGKPAFVKTFVVYKVANLDSGAPATICLMGPDMPSVMEGKYIEVCSGKGKGNTYKLMKVGAHINDRYEGVNYQEVALDKPINKGDILSLSEGNRSAIEKMSIAENYRYIAGKGVSTSTLPGSWHNKDSAEEFSAFKVVGASCRYAMPQMKNIRPCKTRNHHNTGNAKIIEDDGSLSDVFVELNAAEEENYTILEFPVSSNGKITIAETGKHQPRWIVGRNGLSLWCDNEANGQEYECKIFPHTGEEVGLDSEDEECYHLVAARPDKFASSSSIISSASYGLQAALYWRIDDLPFDGKYKIKPRFSFGFNQEFTISARAFLLNDAGHAIISKNYNADKIGPAIGNHIGGARFSLTRDKVEGDSFSDKIKEIKDDIKNLLVFESDVKAKYLYLQLFFRLYEFMSLANANDFFYFSAMPVTCEREANIDKLCVKGYDARHFTVGTYHGSRSESIADRTAQLCVDYGIEIETRSFTQAGNALPGDRAKLEFPFIPFKHGDNFSDKLAEICRAANFSMYSDGSRLHAFHPFRAESIWTANPGDVIKGSFEARAANSVATEWEFSANTWNGKKTLSIDASAATSQIQDFADIESFFGRLIHPGYMNNEIKGFGVRIENSSYYYGKKRTSVESWKLGDKYWAEVFGETERAVCKLVDIRVVENKTSYGFSPDDIYMQTEIVDALFVMVDKPIRLPDSNPYIRIYPLKEQGWQTMVCGNLDIDRASAEYLHGLSQATFDKTKKKAKLDGRYSKHQIAAFGSDEFWLQNFLKTAKHNSFAKHIFSFKVPIDRLPLLSYNLCHLLLRQITLNFGRFKKKPLSCWIVGYSLSPAEDAVRLEVMNSEPMESPKQTLCLDENLLKDQLTIDEREHSEEFYSEA